jgi:F-type H+-transporting ATPase subunit b
MGLIQPDLGTVIWMLVVFGIVFYILAKFAWKPIMGALKQRDLSIENALKSAENARKDIEKIKADNEKIIAKGREERDQMMMEARDIKDKLIAEAKNQANEEAEKLIRSAKQAIENEKATVLTDIRKQVAAFSLEIAEKIIRQKLSDDKEQQKLIDELVKELKLN